MPPDATLRYAAGAGPLVARPPEVDGEALRRAEREREREAAASAPEGPPYAESAPLLPSVQVVGAGVGGTLIVGAGEGTLPSLWPPPHEQHMSFEEKSESS